MTDIVMKPHIEEVILLIKKKREDEGSLVAARPRKTNHPGSSAYRLLPPDIQTFSHRSPLIR